MEMLLTIRQVWPSVSFFMTGFSVLCIVVGLAFSFSVGPQRFDNRGGRVAKIGLLTLLSVIAVWIILDVLTYFKGG